MELLKKKRSQYKKGITTIHNFINAQEQNYSDMKVRVDKLEKIYGQFEDIQEQIETLCETDEELRSADGYRQQVDEMYFAIKSAWVSFQQDNLDSTVIDGASGDTPRTNTEISATIQALVQQQVTTTSLLETMSATLTSVTNLRSSQTQSASPGNSGIRLPSIQIPDFDGNLTNWVRFRDLFKSLVDIKSSLSDVEKLEYLQTKLKGEASTIIKHLTPTNDNYKIAWDLIKKRYDKPIKIKEAYLDMLFNQPSIKNNSLPEVKRFLNNTSECYNALQVLDESVESWDSILVFMIGKKLDQDTSILWYRHQKDDESPSFKELLQFLERRISELESLNKQNTVSKFQKQVKVLTMAASSQCCPVCNGNHAMFNCQQFKVMDVTKRRAIVRSNRLCFNCLRDGHFSSECKSSSCRTCQQKHNTLLHIGGPISSWNNNQQANIDCETSINAHSSQFIAGQTTMLPTAVIMICDRTKSLQPCRALIDSGAQATLITEACAQRLGLSRSHGRILLYGVGGASPSSTKGKVRMEIFAKYNDKTIVVQAHCLSNLTQYIPQQTTVSDKLSFFDNLQLADVGYNKRNRIDVILGADVFGHCVLQGKISHPSGSPTAVETIFGWVLMGNVDHQVVHLTFVAHVCTDLDEQLQRFWETEECQSPSRHLSPEEEKAEKHFKEHYQRLPDGRYMVRLPFKTDSVELGDSRSAALKRLESMEGKFKRNTGLKIEFCKFMDEYKNLHHMAVASSSSRQRYFMPHHAVLKPSSTTTKLRVVFDASCKTSNGLSLNDHLLVGPTVQNDLLTILIKFRKFKVGFTADVEKMYRQVLIHPDDRPYQSILWRTTDNCHPSVYELSTVTYGTAAAPFLATRTLHQVALDNATEFPAVSQEIIDKFYVDDYMSCAPDVKSANSLQGTICSILASAGFNLRKWSSNSQQFLDNIKRNRKAASSELIIDDSETVKTLGLFWNVKLDVFQYSVCLDTGPGALTKRRVLSDISRIFDPVGWLSPVVVSLKIFMQRLWFKGLSWDQDLPSNLKTEWLRLHASLKEIKALKIPRWCQFNVGDRVELHGFSDASELACAAAIFIRIITPTGDISTTLLTAKTRVAPIKQITLPRLELCAAQLMVKLMIKVKRALHYESVDTFGWTDSTIVLSWISDHPRRWKTFIANRTSFIIDNIPACNWRHIPSKQNSADLATRGISAADLITNSLWWQGPQILQSNTLEPQQATSVPDGVDLEERKIIAMAVGIDSPDLLQRYSNFNKMLRITALLLRFINNCKPNSERQKAFITTTELNRAHQILVKKSQQMSYGSEIRILMSGKQLSSGNKLAALTPFIDEFGLLRVGGRLENANIGYDQKHPYILHKHNHLTQLIINDYHHKYLHAGTRQLQYLVGLKYWIPEVTTAIKRTVYRCTMCMRFRQRPYQQRMGDLPSCRLQPGSTFQHVGIDFAGPTLIRSWKGRGSRTYKCWIAVFVCLNTKAIHLEAVTELSTAAFLASLRRFTSRRGNPLHIYTDNGTNFVGCNQELKGLYEFLSTEQNNICQEMSKSQVQWHFIPPSAPNFGGVWEAGVKSMKFHLKRILGNASTTYEELSTLLCQIEGCLNSRPLCLKFAGDMDPLTPAHFLILRPMNSLPDERLIDVDVNRLSRWQYVQRLVQHFWAKWSTEYLSQLQKRPKWLQKMQNLQADDMVLIKDENVPPSLWLMGRITATHPGKDGIVRVATVLTRKGTLKRPISKLCPLFLDG